MVDKYRQHMKDCYERNTLTLSFIRVGVSSHKKKKKCALCFRNSGREVLLYYCSSPSSEVSHQNTLPQNILICTVSIFISCLLIHEIVSHTLFPHLPFSSFYIELTWHDNLFTLKEKKRMI